MKSWILLVVVVVAVSSAATVAVPLLTASPSAATPKFPAPSKPSDGLSSKLVIDGPLIHEFGNLSQGVEERHTWIFRNEGKGPLEVHTVSSTCSCTLAQLGKDSSKYLTIEPGQSAPIELSWKTKEKDGTYSQSATIGTNDPNRPQVVLAVSGTVRPPVVALPGDGSVNFGSVNNDKPQTSRVLIHSPDRPGLKLTRVVTSNPDLLTVEDRVLSPEESKSMNIGAGYMITVTLLPTSKLGAFQEELVVETDHPRREKLAFVVRGKVEGPITMVPNRVILHDASARSGGSLDLTLRSRGQAETEFTVVKKPDHIDVAIVPVGKPDASNSALYRMTVTVPPSTPSGRITGEIVLRTNHPRATEIQVPVDVLVRSAD